MGDRRGMSFLAELRQRKVFRVATVYLVVAWVAVQAASIALPAFDAPPWMLRVVILLFALGFPLALLLAWAFEATPDGIRRASGKVGNKRMGAIVALLVALALAWYFVGQPALRRQGDLARMPERSIAVLPFVNMSGDKANDYFSDGLAETTLDMLAQVEDLKVIARTSSFAFKGKDADMREIGKALGAANLLEGSVQQAGDTVRVTVQLIRAADGSHLWSRHFDRHMSDVFRIQDEVATAVVAALQVSLPAAGREHLLRKRTDNVAAYQEYLKGIALLPDRKVPQMREAIGHFQNAIRLDPTYARADVGIHDAVHLLAVYASVTPEQRALGRSALERALALDPQLGEAHVARAVDFENLGDFAAAEREYRRGVALAPGYATGQQWLGELLAGTMGRFDEGLPYLRRATELDPLSPVILSTYAFNLGQSGRVDEAMAVSDRLIAAHPLVGRSYDDRSALYALRGELVPALRDLRRQDELDPQAVGFRIHRCHQLMDFSALDAAHACIGALARLDPHSTQLVFARARLAWYRGDLDGALRLLAPTGDDGALFRAGLLVSAGRNREALAIYRRMLPGLSGGGPPAPWPGLAFNALNAGIAMRATGEDARGRAWVGAAADMLSKQPYGALVAGRGWSGVSAAAALGNHAAALAALRAGVDAGYAQGLRDLDVDPLLAGLRRDPRYERILAPARAKAAAQVEAARKAGLL
jgi:TolB-like protein